MARPGSLLSSLLLATVVSAFLGVAQAAQNLPPLRLSAADNSTQGLCATFDTGDATSMVIGGCRPAGVFSTSAMSAYVSINTSGAFAVSSAGSVSATQATYLSNPGQLDFLVGTTGFGSALSTTVSGSTFVRVDSRIPFVSMEAPTQYAVFSQSTQILPNDQPSFNSSTNIFFSDASSGAFMGSNLSACTLPPTNNLCAGSRTFKSGSLRSFFFTRFGGPFWRYTSDNKAAFGLRQVVSLVGGYTVYFNGNPMLTLANIAEDDVQQATFVPLNSSLPTFTLTLPTQMLSGPLTTTGTGFAAQVVTGGGPLVASTVGVMRAKVSPGPSQNTLFLDTVYDPKTAIPCLALSDTAANCFALADVSVSPGPVGGNGNIVPASQFVPAIRLTNRTADGSPGLCSTFDTTDATSLVVGPCRPQNIIMTSPLTAFAFLNATTLVFGVNNTSGASVSASQATYLTNPAQVSFGEASSGSGSFNIPTTAGTTYVRIDAVLNYVFQGAGPSSAAQLMNISQATLMLPYDQPTLNASVDSVFSDLAPPGSLGISFPCLAPSTNLVTVSTSSVKIMMFWRFSGPDWKTGVEESIAFGQRRVLSTTGYAVYFNGNPSLTLANIGQADVQRATFVPLAAGNLPTFTLTIPSQLLSGRLNVTCTPQAANSNTVGTLRAKISPGPSSTTMFLDLLYEPKTAVPCLGISNTQANCFLMYFLEVSPGLGAPLSGGGGSGGNGGNGSPSASSSAALSTGGIIGVAVGGAAFVALAAAAAMVVLKKRSGVRTNDMPM